MDIPNSRIGNALDLLRADRKRGVYEGGDHLGRGSGEYFVDYSNGRSPTLTRDDVRIMAERGWLIENPECPGMFKQGRLP